MKEITIRHLEKPPQKNIDDDLNWIFNSLGLSSGRDIKCLANEIVKYIIKTSSQGLNVSSDKIAADLNLTRYTVNHHLRNLINSGLLYRDKRLIYLRGGTLKAALQELRKDIDRIFDELELMAEEIDAELGFVNR